jgi:hypothetical protein
MVRFRQQAAVFLHGRDEARTASSQQDFSYATDRRDGKNVVLITWDDSSE